MLGSARFFSGILGLGWGQMNRSRAVTLIKEERIRVKSGLHGGLPGSNPCAIRVLSASNINWLFLD